MKLETLLALKKSERPDPEFWSEFERGLKAKRLAAIVEPKPWWLGLTLACRRLAPVPAWSMAGAAGAAGLALLLTLRVAAPSGGLTADAAGPVVASRDVVAPVGTTAMSPSAQTSVPPALASAASAPRGDTLRNERGASAPVVERAEASGSAVASVSLDGLLENVGRESARWQAATSVGPVLAAGGARLPVVAGVNGSAVTPGFAVASALAFDFSARGEPEQALANEEEPLLSALDPRQARLLALASEGTNAAPSQSLAQVREQVVHRMNRGEELYASVSRLGVSGDRLSLRF